MKNIESFFKIPWEHWENATIEYMSSKMLTNFEIFKNITKEKWSFNFRDKISIDSENNIITLPKNISFEQFCYIFRMIIDGMAVLNSFTPMHASAIEYKNIQIILCAKSNDGKSYFANKLCNNLERCSLIGDDHIVENGEILYGNSIMRIRSENLPDIYIPNEKNSSTKGKKIIIGIKRFKENRCRTITSKDEMIEKFHELTFTKYLLDPFVANGILYDANEIFNMDIKSKYIENILKFSKELHWISGDEDYIKENLLKYIDDLGE